MFAGYMSEDVVTAEDAFNEALADCNTEAERQALINETLLALYVQNNPLHNFLRIRRKPKKCL